MVFAFVGNAGAVILFVLTAVVWLILGLYTLLFAAHCYTVALQGTLAGLDEVKWSSEPVLDWLGDALALCGLIAIWLVPIGLVARSVKTPWLPEEQFLRILVLAGPVLWLVFPVSLLSSLGSTSRWQILHLGVLGGLIQLLPEVLGFYLLTAALSGVVFALLYLGLIGPAWYVLPVATVAAAAGLLIHARLVGRLGWRLGQLRMARPVRGATGSRPRPRRKRRAISVQDPWKETGENPASPPIVEEGYAIREQDVENSDRKPPPRPAYLDPEPEPYTLAEADRTEPQTPRRVELDEGQVARELAERLRKPPNPPPEYLLLSGVFTFPGYRSTQTTWILLALWMTATGVIWRVVFSLFPS